MGKGLMIFQYYPEISRWFCILTYFFMLISKCVIKGKWATSYKVCKCGASDHSLKLFDQIWILKIITASCNHRAPCLVAKDQPPPNPFPLNGDWPVGEMCFAHRLSESILWAYPLYLKESTESMQSASKFQQTSSQKLKVVP